MADNTKTEVRARESLRQTLLGYKPLSHDEMIALHRYVHDKAMEHVVSAVIKGKAKEGWALQEMALKSLSIVTSIEARLNGLGVGGASTDVLEIRLRRDEGTPNISATDARA